MWKLKILCFENVSLTISSLFGRGGMRLIFSALLASVLVAPVAHAQQPNDDENELEEIVVTATRIPTPLADTLPTTAIITAEDIERIKPQDFGELLKRTSGIGFRDSGGRGSTGGVFVRGAGSDHVLILINGIRTGSATLGTTAIGQIPLESIKRIEIIKGPMSGVYGSDAMGGVIQIFTKDFHEEGAFGAIKTTFGTNNLQKYDAQAGYGDDRYSVYASLSKESTDGIDRTQFKGGGNEDKDSFKQNSGSFSLSVFPQDNLVVEVSHIQSSAAVDIDNISISSKDLTPIELPSQQRVETLDERNSRLLQYEKDCPQVEYRALAEQGEKKAPNPTSDRFCRGVGWYGESNQNITSARFEYEHSDQLSVSGLFGSSTDSNRDINLDTNRDDLFETKKVDYSVQANLNLSSRTHITFGVDYQKDTITSPESRTYDVTERTNKGWFALWQNQFDRSSTVLNVRRDKNDSYGYVSNYSVQQSFELSNHYEIIGSYGTAFKAPTFNDLYWPGQGNPDLEPEQSKSFEISLRARLDDLNWQVSAFQTKVENLIAWAPIIPNDYSGPWQPSNKDNSTLKGVEVELTKVWNDYRFVGSLDYLDAEDDEGNFLPGRARSSASFEFGKQIGNIYVGIDAFAEHGRHDRGKKLPGYALWGLHANYEISESLLISGKVDNLFDKNYVTNRTSSGDDYQNEGRTVQISVEYKF